ncbi:MAG: amidohydrolase family protein [Vicingus serpentipes]|nr:amidohydrolase family protein [Vicingus serpentipes]
MRKISANFIFSGNTPPIQNGVIIINNNGVIIDLIDPKKIDINWKEVEKYEGIICPGFVNTHCHLELSYLKNQLSKRTQLPHFVKEIVSIRDNYSSEERLRGIQLAEQEMLKNGIVAVGDIANGSSTFLTKKMSKIKYHTFIEVFGLDPTKAKEIINKAHKLKKTFLQSNPASITPHAPYSISKELFQLVHEEHEVLATIHNQETKSENELFQSHSGDLFNQLSNFGDHIKGWEPTGKNSLPSYLPQFSASQKVLLVHNTYTSAEDIVFAKQHSKNIYWCFCPNANLYIENTLPDFNLFINEKCTIGTDSLASNWSLSILDELKTISKNYPTIPLEKLIQWATINGAKFLDFNELGTIEKGKSPGLNLIKDIALETLSLKSNSSIQVLN